jgi:TrmH family RNA methyltransferase
MGLPIMKHQNNRGMDAVVKQIRQLRSQEERARTGTFYIEGVRMVNQALQAGAPIELGVIAPDLLGETTAWQTVSRLHEAQIPILELTATAFANISFKENQQGMGAVVRSQLETLADLPLRARAGWVALDGVGNPGNLGAILRTCDAVGCAGIILLGATVDPYHPAALRASMGSIFAQHLVRTTFAEFLAWKQNYGLTVIGTSPAAAQEYRSIAYPTPFILLMGSERLGLSPAQQAACDLLARIPMVGASDSLNLAVATSVVLYEVFHQQRQSAQSTASGD